MAVNRKTILLVEDNAVIALSQKMQLEKYGYNLIHAISGETALEIFIKSNPTIDLVLMDIDLGAGMDGTQAAREILEIRTVPVVFLSSHTEPEMVEKTESITSYGYVVKNSGMTVLDASIKMAFKLFEAHRDILKHKEDSETANKRLHSVITKLEKNNKTLTRLNSAVENTKEVIFITDKTGLITYINPQFTKLYGYTKDEVVGKLNPRFLGSESVTDEINDEFWNKIIKEPHLRAQFINKTKDGKYLTVETSIDPIYDSRGEIKEFVQIQRDISEKIQAEDRYTLITSDANQMKSILDNYEEAIWAVDRDFNFIFANSYLIKDFKEAFGIELKPGMHAFGNVQPEVQKIWEPKYKAALKGEKISFEFKEDAHRGKKYFRVNLNPIHTADKIIGVSAISVDITKQKLAELKAQEEMLKSQQYLDIAGVMFVAINKQGLITLVNKKTCEISGYTEAELIGQNWFELMIPKQLKSDVVSVFRQLLSGEIEPVEYYENPILTKDGEERIIAWHNTILKDKDGNITDYLSSGSDVTEKRMLENRTLNSELLFKTLADFTNDWEYWTAPDGREKYVSPSVEKITGYSPEEFLCTPGFYMELIYAKDIDLLKKHSHSKNAAGQLEPIDFRIIRKNGDVRWISHTCRKIYDEEGNYLGIRGSNRDITERKNAELRIKELLNRNELILKEVHHRIKNHMTTLISLISLQAGRVKSRETVDALGETENRIRGMMVLYDKLYRSADFEYTSVRPYLSGLIDSIFENINHKADIKKRKILSDFKVNAGTIFNIGIIINELITNSIKYAFTDRLSGLITIDISPTDDGFILVVTDNGTGLPADFSLEDNKGFGMELIKMIVLQMNGNFSMEGSNGTKTTISCSFKK